MTVLDILQADMKAAMKAQDPARLSAIRMLVSAIRYSEIDHPGMDDAAMVEVLRHEAKKRREAVDAYKAAGRAESATAEQTELDLIATYLPTQMDETAVRAKVQEYLATNTPADFGSAMRGVMQALKGQADGGMVSKIVKELFHN